MHRVNTLADQTGKPQVPISEGRRAVIVAGARTPFTRAFGELMSLDCIDLGVVAAKGLIERTKIDPKDIDHVVWGGVILRSGAPNTAREIVIDGKLPLHIAGHTETMACASGLKAVLSAVSMIESGNGEIIVAGGSESTSCTEMPLDRKVTQSLALFAAGKINAPKLFSVAGMPWKWMPQRPAVAERSTGKTMGYHADVMAALCGASRGDQDDFAMRSHRLAAAAAEKGLFTGEIVPVQTKATPLTKAALVSKDTMVRGKQDAKKVQALKPVFRKAEQGGSITAATASPLTDGAAACLVMTREKAVEHGYKVFCGVRSWAATAINPQPNLLLAPALGIPLALRRAGLKLSDIDFFEIHEAFAGQVLATVNCLASKDLCQRFLGFPEAVGDIPLDKVNIYGGSVSIGHPFGATGARITTNSLRIFEQHPQAKYVLVSICAAGGLGLVTIFERL
jgi:acetyl-CoA acyltransferase